MRIAVLGPKVSARTFSARTRDLLRGISGAGFGFHQAHEVSRTRKKRAAEQTLRLRIPAVPWEIEQPRLGSGGVGSSAQVA